MTFVRLLLLLAFAISARGALVIGPEKQASPPAFAPTPVGERPLALASDGKDFVALWDRQDWGFEAMYAAKVTDTGALTVPARRIAGGAVAEASIVWTGSTYLAVWTANSSVAGVRLDRDANVVGAVFTIASGSVHALAWDGRRAVAIANDDLGMKVLVMGPEGDLVRERRLPERVAGDVRLVAAGSAFVLVWTANFRDGVATIYAMQLTRDGDPGTKVKLPFPTSSGVFLDAEADRDRVGIAFTEWPGEPWRPQRPLRRYTLDARTLEFTTHPVAMAAHAPEVVAAPGGFVSAVFTTQDPRGEGPWTLETIPFDSQSARASEPVEASAHRPVTASNGRHVLAIWSSGPITGALFDLSLTRRETPVFAVSTSLISQRAPGLAHAGDVALHAWVEESGEVVIARVDSRGNALDAPRVIGSRAWAWENVDVAFGGKVWLVAYWAAVAGEEDPHAVVRRIGLDGVPLDEPSIDLGPTGRIAMASNGDVTLLATLSYNGTHIYPFTAGGMQLQPKTATLSTYLPGAMISNGREFLLIDTWLQGIRFDANGNRIDATPFLVDTLGLYSEGVSLASDGTDWFVAYERRGTIVVRRVRADGTNAGETLFGTGVQPHVALLGTKPVVAYQSAPAAGAPRLYVQEAGGEPQLVAQSVDYIEHTLASRGNSLWLSYARVIDPLDGFSRIFVRAIDDTPPARRRPSGR